MKLFYLPGACSLASHIALIEAGLPYQLVAIDMQKRTADGRDFLAINPRGYIPALEFDDGSVLAESMAVLSYIADRDKGLLPGGRLRWKALEVLSFMATEVHGAFKAFWKKAPQAEQDRARELLLHHFATLEAELGERPFLAGECMSIADPYLLVMLLWAARHGVDVPEGLEAYAARMKTIPSVSQALAEEGLA